MEQRSLDGIVSRQLGRKPRGDWTVRLFCPWGYPVVIETKPYLDDGTPFPTVYWLTCPYLRQELSKLEAEGWKEKLRDQVVSDRLLLDEEMKSEETFAELLGRKGFGKRAYVGGSKTPTTFKCLHAVMAWFLVSRLGAAGRIMLGKIGNIYCDDYRCKEEP